ncbi:MAG: hypothetical protein AAF234_05840 [Pseudomonadota bacterium]
MDRYLDQFNEVSLVAAEKLRADTLADLNHERAGLDTGRSQRFLSPDQSERGDSSKKEAQRRLQTMLDLMLLDPDYAAAYQAADKALSDAETDTEMQIRIAQDRLAEAQTALQTLEDRAAELPDGTKVYFDPESGDIITEDGRVLSEDEAAHIELNGHEPTYGDYLDATQKVETAQDQLNAWYEYQIVLGGYRNEMADTDTPPSAERLGEIQAGIQEHRPEFSEPELQEVVPSSQPELETTSAVSLPTITSGR